MAAENLTKISNSSEARKLLDTGAPPSSPALLARWKMDKANLCKRSVQEQLLREALAPAAASHDPWVLSMVELYLGEVVGETEAASHEDAAFAAAQQANDAFLLTWVDLARGYNNMRFARFDAALPYFDRAAPSARKIGARSLLAGITGNSGWCYFRLGDMDRAMDFFRQADSLSKELGQPDLRLRWIVDMGNVFHSQGDFGRAVDLTRQAAKMAAEIGNEEWEGIAWHNLAQIAIESADLKSAQEYSVKDLQLHPADGDQALRVSSELSAAQIAHLAKDYPKAEAGYKSVIERAPSAHAPNVLWEAQASLASLYSDWGRRKQAGEQFRRAIETIDREWNNLITDESRTTFLSRHLVGLFQNYVDFLIQTGRPEYALEIAESARARMLSRRLESVGGLPPNFNLSALLRATRISHTVILSYWVAPARSAVWVIGSGPLARFDLAPGRQIDELVQKYSTAVTHGRDPLAHDDGVASALYRAVLEPVAKLIPPGSNVIVVPDGSLHQLNFETLIVPGPRPHYWIEDVAIATAPSLRVLSYSAERPATSPRLLLFGDPVLVGQEFGPLPNVKKEIAAVEACFPAVNRTVFTESVAVPDAYAKASPGDFTNIHFATHATANSDSPLNSAIILSHHGENFKLYARDVAAVPLRAELVTISACTSAGAKAYSGEGLMGFAWAFMQSGAWNVIASLWDVDDASSVSIMKGLYMDLSAGQPPPRALRASKLAFIQAGDRGRLPYYWGPLQVFTRRIALPVKPGS